MGGYFLRGYFSGGCIFSGGVYFFGGVYFSGGVFFQGGIFRGGSPPEYGQRSAGSHPTGMHSCFCLGLKEYLF